jgi:TrmH family RNA methyltransferase
MKSVLELEKEVISSRNHPAVKRVRALQSRAERDRTGQFFVEGLRFVAQAAESGAPIASLIHAPALLAQSFGRRIVQTQARRGVPCLAVAPEVLQSVAQNDDPQGIGAVVRQSWTLLEKARAHDGLCWIVLDRVQSPGNLGTIIRTAEAVGAAGLIFLGAQPDPYDPACVRASMAALWSQQLVRATTEEFLAWKAHNGCILVGTSPHATIECDAARYPAPTALFMGWERKGLSSAQEAMCDALVSIPMAGRADSLNLAVATGVMLYEIARQRRSQNAAVAPANT